MKNGAKLSVVVLGYRAEESLITLVKQLELSLASLNLPFDIILVANYWPGKKDKTPHIAHILAKNSPRISTIAKKKKGGMGWDMHHGLKVATGDIIAVIDGDSQNPVEDVVKGVRMLLKDPTLDMVKARRIKRHDGIYRIVQSRLYNTLFRVLFNSNPLNDINGKPKVLTRKALRKIRLTADDWFIDAEIVLQALKLNLRVAEFETIFYKNPQRPSFTSIKTALEFLQNMIMYRVRKWR